MKTKKVKKQAEAKYKKSTKSKLLIAISITLVATIGLVFFVSNFLVSFALDTESSFNMTALMSKVLEQNGQEGGTVEYSGFTGTDEQKTWFSETAEDIYITSEDGLKLHAYRIENENGNGNYVLIFHGYSMQASHMAYSAKHFYDLGFNLLVPDARAHGQSEGRYISMGWPERRDALLWIEEILKIDSDAKIALYGISMGASTVMNTAGEELPENVTVAIEDCGYSSVWDEFKAQLNSLFKLPSFPVLDLAAVFAEIRAGYDLTEASSIEQVKNCQIPMLFIHGSEDAFVPYEMLDPLYNAATCEKEKLVIEGAGHAMSSSVNPDLYWSTIDSFIEKHIGG